MFCSKHRIIKPKLILEIDGTIGNSKQHGFTEMLKFSKF